jgi:hypothetical protein
VHVPSKVVPFLKVTVPVAAEGETVAVSVTLLPTGALVGEADSVVVVAVVAYALVANANRNRSSVARLPQPLSKLVDIARARLRGVITDVVRISNIFKILRFG